MTDLRPPAYDDLSPEARTVVDAWAAGLLVREPQAVVDLLRFLMAMVAVKRGELREITRTEHQGKPVVLLVAPQTENVYTVRDPGLGDAEAGLVAEMERVLGGSNDATCAQPS